MKINPEVIEKKKIIKKVRFHDDDATKRNVSEEMVNQPKVGTKRTLTHTHDINEIGDDDS